MQRATCKQVIGVTQQNQPNQQLEQALKRVGELELRVAELEDENCKLRGG